MRNFLSKFKSNKNKNDTDANKQDMSNQSSSVVSKGKSN